MILVVTGCQTCSYYGQAIHGQFQILHRQRPISAVLADAHTPAKLSNRLDLVLQLRDFAKRDLKLPVDGHYLAYADLGRRFAVWNVYAAPAFSLEAKTWWYPIVGSLEYRGYFDETAARRYATNLLKKGMDVYVGGVEAYSTLGWFHDPVLNTFIFNSEAELAETLFHELAHQRLFISGDTDFNEAFATAVGEEGVRRWLASRSNAVAIANFEAEMRRKEQVIGLLTETRNRLQAIYDGQGHPASGSGGEAKPEPSSSSDVRHLKSALFEQLRRDYQNLKSQWGDADEWDAWFQKPLNNARLNTVDTYYKLVPAFHELLRTDGGNLEKFYESARRIGKLKAEERSARLQSLLRSGNAGTGAASRQTSR